MKKIQDANVFYTAPHAKLFATSTDDSVSMNSSDPAVCVPDEAGGKDVKEGCIAELLLPVSHQLWSGLWQYEVQEKKVLYI